MDIIGEIPRVEKKTQLKQKALTLPTQSGCYQMKDQRGQVIYVGKAKNLKNRVSSYFRNSGHGPKTKILVSHISDFDYILTDSEASAFILENTLIKKYKPRYNIRLKDDKTYPYVVIDFNEDYPMLYFTRKVRLKKSIKNYGPFVHGSNIGEIIKILTKTFQLRDCSLAEFKRRTKPCLLYQIKQCSAPCVSFITKDDYKKSLNYAINFFEGKGRLSLDFLEVEMKQASEAENFELAALRRDQIKILKDFLINSNQRQVNKKEDGRNYDVVAFYVGDSEVDISIYITRNSTLIGKKNFHLSLFDLEEDLSTGLISFLFQYYYNLKEVKPQTIFLEMELSDRKKLASALNLENDHKLTVSSISNKLRSLYETSLEHAKQEQEKRVFAEQGKFLALDKLKDLLNLKERPNLIECYDVAIWQGSSPVASQVVYHQGQSDRASYRHYKLQERAEKNNDFAMMREVLSRRIKHSNLPDLFVVDGGKGQVSSFVNVLEEFQIDIPVVGIAKAKTRDQKKTEERLIIPGRANPFILNKNRSLLNLLTSMRDEAHRFSRVLHHKLEKKKFIHGWLDQINGIGPKTKEKILKKLKVDQRELSTWEIEEIKQELRISAKLAKEIKNYLINNVNELF